MSNKQLTLYERWAIDVESYEKLAKIRELYPQCASCLHFSSCPYIKDKTQAYYCKQSTNERKPKGILRWKGIFRRKGHSGEK
jgi:hypothetical protein